MIQQVVLIVLPALTLGSMMASVTHLEAAVLPGWPGSFHPQDLPCSRKTLPGFLWELFHCSTANIGVDSVLLCDVLGSTGLSDSTIRTYLSGVRQLQVSYGLQEPLINQMPQLRQILRSRRARKGATNAPACPLPL